MVVRRSQGGARIANCLFWSYYAAIGCGSVSAQLFPSLAATGGKRQIDLCGSNAQGVASGLSPNVGINPSQAGSEEKLPEFIAHFLLSRNGWLMNRSGSIRTWRSPLFSPGWRIDPKNSVRLTDEQLFRNANFLCLTPCVSGQRSELAILSRVHIPYMVLGIKDRNITSGRSFCQTFLPKSTPAGYLKKYDKPDNGLIILAERLIYNRSNINDYRFWELSVD